MLEKRIYVSPVDFPPISLETGKMQGSCHVNIVRSVHEDGVLIGKSQTHRTAIVLQPDGAWSYGAEPDPAIAAALAEAFPARLATIAAAVAGSGIMDHEVVKDGQTVTVSYAKDGDVFVRKETPGDA